MPNDFDYLAEARAAGERIAGPLGRARILFKNISRELDVSTAKLIFQLCAQEAVEPDEAPAPSRHPQKIKLPTIARIDAAVDAGDRHQLCVWWARLRGTDQEFSADEKKIIHYLAGRYVEVDGYTKDFDEAKLPPIKREGARTRNPVNAELPTLFDTLKAAHGRKLTDERTAELVIKKFGRKHGPNVEAVLRNERNWRNKNRKV